jgi:phosphate transport system permease protein
MTVRPFDRSAGLEVPPADGAAQGPADVVERQAGDHSVSSRPLGTSGARHDGERRRGMRRFEFLIEWALFLCAVLSIGTTAGIIIVLAAETFAFLREVPVTDFLFGTEWTPLFATPRFGVLPLVAGTMLVSSIAMIVALPMGLLSAVYLSEYANVRVRRFVKPVLEVLAGIPTVVYGYFALLFVTPLLQLFLPNLAGFNALGPGIVMGIMILPLVSSLSEDAMQAVPRGLREGSYALGATKMQTSVRVVLPAAFSGITAACILAVSRAIGETMIVAIAAGQQPRLTANPLLPIETMTAYIVQVSLGDTPQGTIEYRTIFAVGMLLFLGTFILNLVSTWLRERFREEYA